MSRAMALAIDLAERGYVPDAILRRGVRGLARDRLREISAGDCETAADVSTRFVREMGAAEVAPLPEKANEQHYEVPARFFELVLGKHRKYSCCYWDEETASLDDAEARALEITAQRARLADGMRILELGCGWGSLSLWMAEHFPNAQITAVSNSASQRAYVSELARARGLENLRLITADMNDFHLDQQFDRVVSVEMFEHMRNYQALFARIAGWLVPGGMFFMHIFCHRSVPYAFELAGESDWMSRHFFSGGIMPSDELPLRFQSDLRLVDHWRWSGTHYQRTAEAWLANMDANRSRVESVLAEVYGDDQVRRWWMRWRLFFVACAELFGFAAGQEWWVSHYAFRRPER